MKKKKKGVQKKTNSEMMEKTKEEIKLGGVTAATETEYLKKLILFMEHYGNQPIYDMNETEIRGFLLWLISEKQNPSSTVNACNSALRFVFGDER